MLRDEQSIFGYLIDQDERLRDIIFDNLKCPLFDKKILFDGVTEKSGVSQGVLVNFKPAKESNERS